MHPSQSQSIKPMQKLFQKHFQSGNGDTFTNCIGVGCDTSLSGWTKIFSTTLLTLTFLIFFLCSKGQYIRDFVWTSGIKKTSWPVCDTGIWLKKSIASFEKDTIPVLILYSDTATCYSTSNYPKWTNGELRYVTDTLNSYKMAWVNCAKAYMVYNRSVAYEKTNYDDTTQYLDENKQPLKKSYIIWQVKHLK